MKEDIKAWCQRHHCEALAQLAAYEPARKALQRDASVVPALEAVAETGLSEEAREIAIAALMALSDKELEAKVEGQKHVMLSCASTIWFCCGAVSTVPHGSSSVIAGCLLLCFDARATRLSRQNDGIVPSSNSGHCGTVCDADQWDVQAAIKRLNDSLKARGYVTWFDLTNMKGELTACRSLLRDICGQLLLSHQCASIHGCRQAARSMQ